jgi:propionate catabolism operon transcriptional regulator
VAVNCGSIPAQLVEAELFGYEAGAFTGARRDGNAGRFEDADGGTLFLDEVSELPFPAQTALLRLLQEKEVVRLGGSTPRPVNVRVVAATNKPLDQEVRAGRFRNDLYYRLAVLSISVPPLRDRGEDIAALAKVFLAEAEADVGRRNLWMADDAVRALQGHAWPGNVRELKNVILRAAATAPLEQLTAADLVFPASAPPRTPASAPAAPEGGAIAEVSPMDGLQDPKLHRAVPRLEREALVEVIAACGWNLTRTARQLGISRMTLYRWVNKYGLSRELASSH